jgi:hypothetical protein
VNLRIVCDERDGSWIARAVRDDNGDPFGVECRAATRDEAEARLRRWLDWQREHAEALQALQQAEHAYHRTVAGSAFAPEDGSALENQKAALKTVEAARIRLDAVRAARPEAT